MKKKFTYFWESYSPFSNWYLSDFKVGDRQFNCMEQYMMYNKAIMFGDFKTASKIMESHSPRVQKELGRGVSNFNPMVWDDEKENMVFLGLKAKFEQNPKLLSKLMETKDTTIVEASPLDTIWGAGLDAQGCENTPESEWLGQNLLGKLLTKLRDEL